tara:strand:- start:67345 stop:67950 length:606 start_codon:yes stop_codon:yes gene_type:complete
MKKIYALVPLIFTAFVSTSTLAGTCSLKLVDEDGNFSSADYGPGGRVTYDVVMPFTDGYYPNWTTSQPKPRLPFSNCITYKGVPYNAKITSIVYNYEFQEAVLVADYEVMMGFFGAQPQNQFIYPLKRGGGNPRGSGIPLVGGGVYNGVNNQLLRTIDLELRSRVNNPAVNSDCPSYYDRDECRTKNSCLTKFTVDINWSN